MISMGKSLATRSACSTRAMVCSDSAGHLVHLQDAVGHLGQGLLSVTRDVVQGGADVVEGLLQGVHVDLGGAGLLVDSGALGLEPFGGAGDELGGRVGDRLHLFQDDPLVRQGQGQGHRHLQGTHGDVERPVDAPDQLLVVADDHLHRQEALLVDQQLLLQVLDALAQRKQQFFLDELVARVGLRDLRLQPVLQPGVDELAQLDGPLQLVGQLAHQPSGRRPG